MNRPQAPKVTDTKNMGKMLNRSAVRHPQVVRRSVAQLAGGRYGVLAANPTWVPSSWWFNPITVAGALIALFVSFSVVLRNHCLETSFGSPGQFRYACYSDVPANALTAQFNSWVPPLWDSTASGFLTSVGSTQLLWLCSMLAPNGERELVHAFWIQAMLATFALVVMAYAVFRTCTDDPWRLLLIAASPLIFVESLIGFEAVGAAFAALSVFAGTKGRATTAGVLAGVAALIVPAYLLLLLAVVVTMWRRFDMPTAMYSAVGGALVYCVVHMSQYISQPDVFSQAVQAIFPAAAGYGGLWFIPSLTGSTVPADVVTWGSRFLIVAWIVAVSLWAARKVEPLPLPTLALVYLVGFVLISPAVPVQAGMWLLPLAATGVRRLDVVAVWMLFEVFFAVMTWQFIYDMSEANKGAPDWVYAVAVYGRGLFLILMATAMGYGSGRSSSELSTDNALRVRQSADEAVH